MKAVPEKAGKVRKGGKMKCLFVSMPPSYDYEKEESKQYRALRNEYFKVYTIIRTNKTLKNVDSHKLHYIDNLHSLNYALLSFISIAKKEGAATKYFAPNGKNWLKELSRELAAFRPNIVYLGCSHSTSYKDSLKAIRKIRETRKNTRIVAGGQYLTGLRKPIKGALVAKGDGFLPFYWTLVSEEPFSFKIITASDVPEKIKNAFFDKYEDFPYLDLDSFNLPIMPVGRIYFQLGCLNRAVGHKPWLEGYVAGKSCLNLTFSVQTRLEDFLRCRDLFERFAKIGLVEVHFGIESSSQPIIDRFGGKLEASHVLKALEIAKKSRVNVLGHFLIGLPGETKESMEKDTALIEKLMGKGLLDFPEFRYVAYFPGTPFYSQAEKFGIRLTEKNPAKIVPEFEKPSFGLLTISKKEMVRLLHKRYRKTISALKAEIKRKGFKARKEGALEKTLF
ncbi:MAG: radical SAM protein [Candidatus Diapherotrites archaeon]|nr:radical SAM protein [Candidatus Diapherotrites archaeon]